MLRMVSLSDAGEPVRSRLPAVRGRRRPGPPPGPGPVGTRPAGHHRPGVVRAGARGPRPGLAPAAGLARRERGGAAAGPAPRGVGRPGGTRSAGPTASSTAAPGCRAPPSGWPGDDADPTPLEREFLATSQARADDARLAKERQIRHERRQNRRLRVLLAGVAALLLVAAGVGALAVDRGRDGRPRRDLAEQCVRGGAQHEALVGRSLTLRSTNRSVAALLAVRGLPDPTGPPVPSRRSSPPSRRPRGSSAISTSRATTGSTPRGSRAHRAPSWPGPPATSVSSASSTGTITHPFGAPLPRALDYVGAAGQRGREPGGAAGLHAARPRQVRRPRVARATATGGAVPAWSSTTSRRANGCSVRSRCRSAAEDVAISDYGDLVAVAGGYDGDLATYDVDDRPPAGATRRAAATRTGVKLSRDTAAVAFDGSGDVYLGSMAGPIRQVDPRTLEVRQDLPGAADVLTRGSRGHGRGAAGLTTCWSPPATRPCSPSTSTSGRRRWVADLRAELFPSRVRSSPSPKGSPGLLRQPLRAGRGARPGHGSEDRPPSRPSARQRRGSIGGVASGVAELVGFAAGEAAYSRWRLDGSDLVARLRVEDAAAPIGYDPSGSYLLVESLVGDRPDDGTASEWRRRGRPPTS